jgi:AmmeMemoRadiSam system protein B
VTIFESGIPECHEKMSTDPRENDYPKLRSLEAVPAQNGLICIRDPEGISEKHAFLPRDLIFIVSLFDGNHSILDIQTAFTRKYGELLFSSKVREIIETLDNCLFLENEHFRREKKKIEDAFRSTEVREASHAGVSYEKEPKPLKEQLKGLFEPPEGPGFPVSDEHGGKIRGVIAPHIDIRRGGPCFAWSYAELMKGSSSTTFVVLGISHVQTKHCFVLTEKDFSTPLGMVSADKDFIHSVSERCTTDFFEDELVHRREHSVEFQALFLRFLFPKHEGIRMVPILCSFNDEIYAQTPQKNPEFVEFISALRETLDQRGERALCIASVDLSHLGRLFGQDLTISPDLLRWAKEQDMNMIQYILDRDAENFFSLIKQENDRRNVCGVPAIYSLLKLIEAQSGRLLKYDQSVDSAHQSLVTFMSAAFYA